MDKPDFGQQTREIPNPDGTTTIETDSFHSGDKTWVKVETRKDIKTSHHTLLADVVACLDVFKHSMTPTLDIFIKRDKDGTPYLIQKTWQVRKERTK